MVPIPREEDFGIDFSFQPRIPSGPYTETVAELGSLHVKGGGEGLAYGGFNVQGDWKQYACIWLRSLATPLDLARVDAACHAIECFSLWPLWRIFLQQAALPCEVVFITRSAVDASYILQPPTTAPHPKGAGHGDGMQWTVDLGPPILRLTKEGLESAELCQRAVAVLRTWMTYDRLILMRYHQSIFVLDSITKWRTDYPDVLGVTPWQFWTSQPGANIAHLCATAGPILTNLGVHVQRQDDWAAYNLVPILAWIDAQGHLHRMGKGLLEGLRGTQARGVGPRDTAPGAHLQSP